MHPRLIMFLSRKADYMAYLLRAADHEQSSTGMMEDDEDLMMDDMLILWNLWCD